MTRYSKTMTEALQEIREGFSAKQIKMAIGVASDKRYAGGNMTGAVDAIEKIKKGLSDHPQVAAVLKRQNEDLEEELDEGSVEFLDHDASDKDFVALAKKYKLKVKSDGEDTVATGDPKNIEKLLQTMYGNDWKDMYSVKGGKYTEEEKAVNKEEVDLDERKFEPAKSATGYDIFHKDFSSAMQHATAFAKSKGQPIKKDEIDNKVATGPRKPSPGKENSYTLETEKGKRWSVQVYNMGSKFELNMYLTSSYVPEGEELTEGKMKDRLMKAQDLMGPSKNREQGIEFVMKGLKVSKKEATKLVDAVLDMMMNNEVEIDEMKMDDPKLVKTFDKLKRGDTVKLKTSSTINKGTDFVDYVVKAKNVVNKGRVEKITLVTKGNEKAVKKFLYKRDGKVTFAIGDMGASIDDIKEAALTIAEKLKVSDGLGAWIDDFKKSDAPQFQGKSEEDRKKMAIAAFTDAGGKLDEETELDEAPKMKYALVGKDMKIYSMGSDERDLRLDRRSLEQRFKDAAPLKMARLKTAQSIGDKVDKSQLKEEEEPNKPDTAKAVDQGREDKKKTRIAQLQLQIAKATETINKLNTQEKPDA